MKSLQATLLMLVLALSITVSSAYSYGAPDLNQGNQVALWLILRFKDCETDMPVYNVSVTARVSTSWGQKTIGPITINETGVAQAFFGKVVKPSTLQPASLLMLRLSNNYTLIKVQDPFLEDKDYTAEYVSGMTTYTELQMSLDQKSLADQVVIEGNIWLLKGKIITVSDHSPLTAERRNISLKPAVKATVGNEKNDYESYYLFPLNYEVTIIDKTQSIVEPYYPPLTVKVNENSTLINWSYHAAKAYVDRETSIMDKDMEWLGSSSYPLDREMEEYQAIKSLWERVLDLYQKGEYGPALGGSRLSVNRLESLKKWLSDLNLLAIVSSVGIFLFAYGLASLLSSFIFEEPSENKKRLIGKISIFSLLMLVFSLTHPSLKITYAIMFGAIAARIDLPISLLGGFITGSLTYFFIELISLRKSSTTSLAMQLGIRSLKRRLSRTILALFTITIVVSSAMVFVNVSMSRSTRIKDSWEGTDMAGVLVKPDIYFKPDAYLVTLSEYDMNWTREQEWYQDLGYREIVRQYEPLDSTRIARETLILLGEQEPFIDLVSVDPAFLGKYYNFSGSIRGFWQEFQAEEPVVILSSSFEVATGEYVTLGIDTWLFPGTAPPAFLGRTTLGPFRVVGTFEPEILSQMKKMDNEPLFEKTTNLVLIPIRTVKEKFMILSEVEIRTKEDADPVKVAEELAYTFGIPTIANKNRLAVLIEWSLELSVIGLFPYLPPLAIASLMMYVTMASIYEERRREFITLATLGLDPRNTFQIFIVEALLLGLLGTFLGFFGSYILVAVLVFLTNLLGLYGVSGALISYAQWSMPAILVALFTGVVMVFLGGYIPAVRAQGISLMGRVKKKEIWNLELVSEAKITSYKLPIKETVQNGEMLYTYVRETIGKFERSLIDYHSIKGAIYGDGSFNVSFIVRGPSDIFVPCEIKGEREREILVPVIEFPTEYKGYEKIRDILRDLEEYMIGFSAWKETQLKMNIVREAPRKQKTLEEILTEIQGVIAQIKDGNKKLKILDSQKGKISEEIYNEFKQKYMGIIEEKSKTVRSMAIGLEPYSNDLQAEISKINVELERITAAHSLGEISEEEYIKTAGPLQGRISVLKGKVKELEEIFDFLKRPMGMI